MPTPGRLICNIRRILYACAVVSSSGISLPLASHPSVFGYFRPTSIHTGPLYVLLQALIRSYNEIRGRYFPPAELGTDGSGLLKQLKGCGDVTDWDFELTPKDPVYQWYAHGHLPIGTKSCVGHATESAGGTSTGNCHGAG